MSLDTSPRMDAQLCKASLKQADEYERLVKAAKSDPTTYFVVLLGGRLGYAAVR